MLELTSIDLSVLSVVVVVVVVVVVAMKIPIFAQCFVCISNFDWISGN